MTRQISKGSCAFCHRELSKSSMTRHLQSCEQRVARQAEAGSYQELQKTKVFHLVVVGYRLPMYWMHLEVDAGTTLAILDRFLRNTWLECCGHLSVFRIGGFNHYVDAETDAYWDMHQKNMQVTLEEVLSPGQTCSYEYDFGSTTELLLKVISEYEVEEDRKEKAIQILARNSLSIIPCAGCGEPAISFCTQCIYEGENNSCLCKACAKSHACAEAMILPIVNSPRAGVCGYTGQTRAYTFW